jgi:hypothetical protein
MSVHFGQVKTRNLEGAHAQHNQEVSSGNNKQVQSLGRRVLSNHFSGTEVD